MLIFPRFNTSCEIYISQSAFAAQYYNTFVVLTNIAVFLSAPAATRGYCSWLTIYQVT